MHDYTARIIHEDHTANLRREADAFRLASEARQGQPRHRLPARIWRLVGQRFARWAERSARPTGAGGSLLVSDPEPGAVMPTAD